MAISVGSRRIRQEMYPNRQTHEGSADYTFSFSAFLKFEVAAKLGDVTLRRSAEKLFVLAAKVRRGFIAHTKPGARRVQVFAEHQTACFLESYLFLKLQRLIAVTDLK
jgi:hypothetical protein